ncbi:hypothetical protein Tco_0754914 [Tanacetum coccineum]
MKIFQIGKKLASEEAEASVEKEKAQNHLVHSVLLGAQSNQSWPLIVVVFSCPMDGFRIAKLSLVVSEVGRSGVKGFCCLVAGLRWKTVNSTMRVLAGYEFKGEQGMSFETWQKEPLNKYECIIVVVLVGL